MKKNETKVNSNAGKLNIDPAMDKLSSVILFPAKLEFANSQLKKVGYPHLQRNQIKKPY